MADIKDTLTERGTKYGNYKDQTRISRSLMDEMQTTQVWDSLETDQEDALMMIAVKISRILNGDPNYADNWHDIAGYATLVADRLDGNERK